MIFEYNILWFENNQEFYNLSKPNLESYLVELGFNPCTIQKKDDSDLKNLIQKKDIDLILVDQNLRYNVKGDDVVNTFRINDIFTKIILYSQYRDYEDDIKKNLDGVYFTDREQLEEKAKKIIDETLKRDLDISHIRGTFIAETIYATSQMEEIIAKIMASDGPKRDFFIDQMQDELFSDFLKYKILKRYLDEEIKAANVAIAAGKGTPNPHIVERKAKLDPLNSTFGDFQKEIIEFRNVLAHAKQCPEKRNALMVKNKNSHKLQEQVFDAKYCQEIRNMFKKHSKALEDLFSLLQ